MDPFNLGGPNAMNADDPSLPEGLPTETPTGTPVASWTMCPEANYVFLPEPRAGLAYCSVCAKWIKISTTVHNIRAHIRRAIHTQLPGSPDQGKNSLTLQQRQALVKKHILLNALPIALIECPHLRELVPGLPNRQRFTAELAQIASETEQDLIAKIRQSEFASIQFDGWTDRANRRFLGVMAHVLHEGTFTQCHLATVPIGSLHADAQFISERIEEVLFRFGLSPESSVTDTEATELAAIKLLNRRREEQSQPPIAWFPCICHILNLVLKQFYETGASHFAVMKSLQRILSRSTVFTEFCREQGAKRTTIPELEPTRWSSMYRMVHAIVELRPTIIAFRDVSRPMIDITDDAFILADQIHETLREFKDILVQFESDAFGNICKVYPAFIAIRTLLKNTPSNWTAAATAAATKLSELEGKHQERLCPLIHVAARLDPNFNHNAIFTLEELRDIDDLIIRQIEIESGPETGRIPAGLAAHGHAPRRRRDPFAALRMASGASAGPVEMGPREQLEAHLSTVRRIIDGAEGEDREDIDVTQYWLKKRNVWPGLSRYALKVITRPCASVSTERHFSLTGRIEGLRRLRLLPGHVSELAMIMGNSDLAERRIR